MNIHEYQAKELLQAYGIPIPRGYAAHNSSEIDTALSQLNDDDMIVVKAQIHAGGRGKGTFRDGYKGGVQVVHGRAAAREAANHMLNNTLITAQTGPNGRKVQTLYLTEGCDIQHEYYLAVVLDRDTAQAVIIASTEGGMDIEKVAANSPEKLIRVPVPPTMGLRPHQCRQVAFALGFKDAQVKQFAAILTNLYRMFWEKNALLVEINPLVTDRAGMLSALDAKVSFDDNAVFQHVDIQQLRDLNEEDPKEIEASKHSLAYIALDGNIACMVNGAGLAMATMDIIQSFGGAPANFLDVGGGANEAQVTAAFKIILSDPNVKGILVNIFGGIMRCDVIARGIVAAAQNVDITVPLVVRLEGTNVDAGKQILRDSDVALMPADSLAEAAEQIVTQVKTQA